MFSRRERTPVCNTALDFSYCRYLAMSHVDFKDGVHRFVRHTGQTARLEMKALELMLCC